MIDRGSSLCGRGRKLSEYQTGIWNEDQMEGHRMLVSAAHKFKVPILSQLHHAGIRTVSGRPASPSAFHGTLRGREYTADEMSEDEILLREQQFIELLSGQGCRI